MPIDLGQVDWLYVIVLAILVFVATLVGGVLSFGRRWIGATLSTLLFVALFVFWTYYPHRVPLPKTITLPNTPTTTAAPPPPARRSGSAAKTEKSGHGHYAAAGTPRRQRLLRRAPSADNATPPAAPAR